MFIKDSIEQLGTKVLTSIENFGKMVIFFVSAVFLVFTPPYRLKNYLDTLEFVGVGSLFIIFLTGSFTGAVLALQGAYAFSQFNAEGLTGATVALTLTRELAPVLTGLMVTGRAVSAMATEIGTMRVTEQIDALHTMAINPIHYLVSPRIFSTIFMMPILTMIFNMVGMIGAYLVAVVMMNIDPGIFMDKIKWMLDLQDLNSGLIKALVFGAIISLNGTYYGYNTTGGARGVGEATTKAVVSSSILIFVTDYFLTSIMFT
jgi:phospholipid/cholesterol/gamma-HCH transport system permease protein